MAEINDFLEDVPLMHIEIFQTSSLGELRSAAVCTPVFVQTSICAFPLESMAESVDASGSPPTLRAEKAAILEAIRALPAGSQPNLSSLVYSRAALINHHTTDGIDFNPPVLWVALILSLLLHQP